MTEKIRRFIKNVLRADAFKSVVSLFLLNQFQASLAVRHLPFAHSSRIPPAFLPHPNFHFRSQFTSRSIAFLLI